MVSYADFITLLFAFFVVMYSISSVNKGKYETFSESLDQALFHEEKIEKEVKPIQIGTIPTTIQPIELPNLITVSEEERQLSEEILQEKQRLDDVSEKFQDVLHPYVESKLVGIKKHDFWVELEMNSELLFASGKAELSIKAQPVLVKVAEVVRDVPNVINVEGYTDDVPISTGFYPSNWDLSSARATSVVKELVKNNIPPTRLSAVGYGEFHPIADNKDEEGRFKNRRVVLVLMSQAFARYGMSDDERAKVLNLAPQPARPDAVEQKAADAPQPSQAQP
jgi:chemotaxis protein MotB